MAVETVKDNVVPIKEEEHIYDSLEDLVAGDRPIKVQYKKIDGFEPNKKMRIGSVTAGEMIEWQEANQSEDPRVKQEGGLRLIAQSLVGPEPDNKRYASGNNLKKSVALFRTFRHSVTERILEDILDLNEIKVKGRSAKKTEEDVKKD